jgi:hypothetical protein
MGGHLGRTGLLLRLSRLDILPAIRTFFFADNARADAMTAIINKFRRDIPPMLIDAVHGADGTPGDLAILLAGIVEGTMRCD